MLLKFSVTLREMAQFQDENRTPLASWQNYPLPLGELDSKGEIGAVGDKPIKDHAGSNPFIDDNGVPIADYL
ncbi:unnamed protein product [Thelazia callipaeda]|uniref:COesterase domain-containing protein n=1 Tax=Thelazia callipaeda TaxID=103827 RepID=A0A0N5CQU1_THECL|nr:unnamed protein product [Thelazia callipaeda]